MKFIQYLIGLSILCTSFAASAQVPDNPASNDAPQPEKESRQKITEVLINQPYTTKSLGDMTLPFMWEAQEDEARKRLVITESRTTSPAVITVDLVAVPADIPKLDIAREIASSLAESLGTSTTITSQKKTYENCGKKKCPSVDIYKAVFSGIENGYNRNCALQIVPAGSEFLVLTICTLADKQYSPELPVILDTFFSNMK